MRGTARGPGNENESFLDAAPVRGRVRAAAGALPGPRRHADLRVRHDPKATFRDVTQFAEHLDAFLGACPPELRYSVEIRNKEYLVPAYFEVLREHRTAHVFNAWTRMPELREQLAIDAAYTTDFTIARALLRHGRSYEQAVAQFQPYDRTQEVNPGAREGLKELMERALARASRRYSS